VEKLVPFPQRNRKRLVHVHAAYRIAHQPACAGGSRNPGVGVRGLRRGSGLIPKHTADDTAQEPHAPGNDEQPEQKSHNAREKVHLNDCVLNGPFWLITPHSAVRAVYARRKGPVKRKGVISRGCEANCALLFWTKRFKYKLTRLVTTSYMKSAGIAPCIASKVQIHALTVGHALTPPPESGQFPCRGAIHRGSGSSHLLADNFRRQRSKCDRRRGPSR
jgi:hypothetical protein